MDQLINQHFDIYLAEAPPRFLGTGRLEYAAALAHYQIAFTSPIDLCGWLTVPALALSAAAAPVFDESKVVFTITRGYAVAIWRVVYLAGGVTEQSYADLCFPAAALWVVENGPCTCKPTCPPDCKGQCGCERCKLDYIDAMSADYE